MDMTNGNARVLRPSEYNIWDQEELPVETVETSETTTHNRSFGIALGLPLMQIVIVVASLVFAASNDSLDTLALTVLGFFSLGLFGDIVGLFFSFRGINHDGDKRCTIPLLLNILVLVPKVIAYFALLSQL